METANKKQIESLLKGKYYTASELSKKTENKISRTMLERYMAGIGNPKYTGKKTADLGKLTLDNAVILTKIADNILGTKMKTDERILSEILLIKNEIEYTDSKNKKIQLDAKTEALEWVLSGNEPKYIF